MSLLLWAFSSCPLGGFLHLGSVCFGGDTGRFPHSADLWQEHGSSCFLSEAARGMSTVWIENYSFPSWCVWSSTALINQFWGLKWDIVFSILCSVFGKRWRKYSHSSLFSLSLFCFLLFLLKHKMKWFANKLNIRSKKYFIFSPHRVCVKINRNRLYRENITFPPLLKIKQFLHYWSFLQVNHKPTYWVQPATGW